MGEGMTSDDYERLTQRLMRLITQRAPVTTTKLEHNVTLRGRSTSNQIDVLWEFTAADGSPRRVIIECRRHKNRLKQKDVFAFRGVVDDLHTDTLPTTGVMATTSGYQSGAQAERDKLQYSLRRQLGRQFDQLTHQELVDRIDELTQHNQRLVDQHHQISALAEQLQQRVGELEDDLTAACTSLRRTIRDTNYFQER